VILDLLPPPDPEGTSAARALPLEGFIGAPHTTAALLRVLVIEDNPGDARLVREWLAEVPDARCRLTWLNRCAAALACLEAEQPDVLLLDLFLPDSQGLDTFQRVQAAAPSVPIIVLTGLANERLGIQAVHEGAQDYLLKGQVDGPLLLRSMRYAIERKRSEAERLALLGQARAQQAWLETVIERSPVGIVLVQGAGAERVVANRRAQALLDIHPAPEGGADQDLGRVCRPDGTPLEREQTPALRALRGEELVAHEVLARRADGQEVPILTYASPIRGMDERILGAVAVFEDITPLKDLERLRQEWTAMVAHDLRGPLTSILGWAHILAERAKRQRDAAEDRKAIERISSSALQVQRLVNDLLDAAQAEIGHLSVRPRVADVPVLVQEVVQRTAAETRGHPVRTRIRGAIPPANLDPGRVEQVLGNLLSNAAKYGTPGTAILVTVSASNGWVEVEVTNRGPGIPTEELPHLFSRYYRTREALTSHVHGIGLGLYLCRELVEAHGGRIWCESTPGRSTSVHFTLPACQ
jgi:signal transduction histidine kinase